MKCNRKQTYSSEHTARNAAFGFGGAQTGRGLTVFWCDEHQGWHTKRKEKRPRFKACPRCGEKRIRCRCVLEAEQMIDPWGAR